MSVLAAGPAHGYAIITALRARSDGMFDLPEATVYPALHRLEDAGAAGQLLGGRRGAAAPGLRADQQGRGRAGRRADGVEALRRRRAGGAGVVGLTDDLIARYLAELKAGRGRTGAGRADPRGGGGPPGASAAAGQAMGITERDARRRR